MATEAIYGDMPKNWHLMSIGELVESGNADLQTGPFGTMLHASSYEAVGTPVIAVKHVGENKILYEDLPRVDESIAQKLSRYKLETNDIVLCRKGAVERRARVKPGEAGWLQGSDCIRLRILGANVDPIFVSYVFGSRAYRSWIARHAHGATMPSLNQEIVSRIPLPLPPLSEQKAIAHVLGTLDDKIELNRRMNETLEAMARAIFKSWFVDFDPVRAKADGKKPYGMDEATAALFPDAFQDSPLGKIPQGWEVKPLPEVIEINPRRQIQKGSITPYVEMASVPTHSVRVAAWRDREFKSGSKFMNGDVLLARITPCLENGKTAFVDFLENDEQIAWGSTEFIVMRSQEPLPVEFSYLLARQADFRMFAITNMTGSSGRQRVPADCFNSYDIAVPSTQIAKAFGRIVRPLFQAIRRNDQESQTLAEIRDTLLPKLLSGELRVGDAERFLANKSTVENNLGGST